MYGSEYWPEGPLTESPAGILMEISTGTILYEKNSLEQHYPASITKIMTTLLALENSELNEIVTFSDDAINNTEGSGIFRDYGEQMTMEQCLYAVMLNSANECAYAVAEHVGGGDIQKFVDMMNEKATELGCKNTHFTNPHGLFDENHYTCSYDMALIARAAYQNETFRFITGTPRYTIPPTNKHEEQTDLQNHNEMLYPFKTMKYRYEYCTGGKTGYTDVARSTLVTYAEKDGMALVCVVMQTESPNQWLDSMNLFDYGFDNFQLFNIAENETKYESPETIESGALVNQSAFVDIDRNANIVLPKTAEFADAVSEVTYENISDSVVGSLSYTYAGHEVGKADIKKTGTVIEGFVFDNQSEENTEAPEEVSTIQIKPLTIILIAVLVILLLLLLFFAKRLMDNYYIIRHNMEVRREQKQLKRGNHRRKRRRRR